MGILALSILWLVRLIHAEEASCLKGCMDTLSGVLNADDACTRFKHAPPNAQPFAECQKGFHIGQNIACLHRCSTPPSQWKIHVEKIAKARLAGCKAGHDTAEFRACAYGFHLVALKVFEYGFQVDHTPLEENISKTVEAYISYPIETSRKTTVYAYMDETSSPSATAGAFCAQQSLHYEEEIECINQVQYGLQKRLENDQWQSVFPRVMLFLPVSLNGKEYKLLAFHGETPKETAQSFCAQILESKDEISLCFDGLFPTLQTEMSRVQLNDE